MRKLLLGLTAVLVIAVIGFALFGPVNADETAADAQANQTALIQQQTVNTTVSSTGMLDASQTVYLTFGVAGTVEEIMVDVGDSVTVDQTLAQLNTTDLAYEVESASQDLKLQQITYDDLIAGPTESEVLAAETALASAHQQLESQQNNQEIIPVNIESSCENVVVANEALETAQTAYDDYVLAGYALDPTFIPDPDSEAAAQLSDAMEQVESSESSCTVTEINNEDTGQLAIAQANVEKAELDLAKVMAGPTEQEIENAAAQVRQAEINLEKAEANFAAATLHAPFGGTVLDVQVLTGETIGATTAVITLADTNKMQLVIQVDEEDVLKLVAGQTAQVELDAVDDSTLVGVVDRVSPAGTESQGLVTYDVWITLDNATSSEETTSQESAPEVTDAQTPAANSAPQGGFGGEQNADMQVLFPIFRELGGVQVVTELLSTEEGQAEFLEKVAALEGGDEILATIETMGGPAALAETLSNFGGGNTPPNGGNFTPPAAAQSTDTTTPPTTNTKSTGSAAGLELRIGMTAEAEIVVETLQDALLVPTTAIQRQGPNQYIVVEVDGSDPQQVIVETGPTTNGFTVIYGEVAVNQTVIIPASEGTTQTSGGFPGGPGGGLGGFGGFGGGQ